MKFKQIIVGVVLAGALLGIAPRGLAIPNLTLYDNRELGFANYGIPAGDDDVVAYVNAMISLGLGQSTTVVRSGQINTITRSMNDFGSLGTAVLDARTTYGTVSGSTVVIDLGTGGYDYLLAKYDGPNFGSEVWDVTGLTGLVEIPSKAGKYGISCSTLFSANSPPIPDGGATILMLATALTGLGWLDRRYKRQVQG